MDRKIRKPTQKRALEKYDKIIDAAFKLFNENGYYNTTTADIAAEANVATGSIYAYFKDKKDIYLQVLKNTSEDFNYPTKNFWIENNDKDLHEPSIVKNLFTKFLKLMLEHHSFSKTFQQELNALRLLDQDIGNLVNKQHMERLSKVIEIINILNISFKSDNDLQIFCHYSNLLVDDACHKILYDDSLKDTNLYLAKCVDMLYALFISTVKLK